MQRFLVVFDTNVIVSALLSKNDDNNELQLLRYIDEKVIIPLFSDEIMNEYKEVLSRKEFGFTKHNIANIIVIFKKKGINVNPKRLDIDFKDKSDLKFYEVVMDKKDKNAKLVTGNIKDYPVDRKIVTPKELLRMIKK